MSKYAQGKISNLGVVDDQCRINLKIRVFEDLDEKSTEMRETNWLSLTVEQYDKIKEVLRG